MQRPHPAHRATAPAHRLGPGEVADGRLKHLGHDFGRRTPGFLDGGEIDRAFGGVAFLKLIAGQARAAQEALDRLVGRTNLGAFAFLADGGAFRQQPLDRQRQAARRGQGSGPGIGQTSLDQTIGDPLFQVLTGAGLHTRGDLLGKQFDQQVGHFRSLE